MVLVLSVGDEDAVFIERDEFGLMVAAVLRAAPGGVVAAVALRVEADFAEPTPGFAFVVGDGAVDGVAVGEGIFAAAVGGMKFGEWVLVSPQADEAAIGQAAKCGHGEGGGEARGLAFGPGLAFVFGERFVVANLGFAHADEPATGIGGWRADDAGGGKGVGQSKRTETQQRKSNFENHIQNKERSNRPKSERMMLVWYSDHPVAGSFLSCER